MKLRRLIRNFAHHYGSLFAHRLWVQWYLSKVVSSLILRGVLHDWSKCLPDEARGFIRTIDRLSSTTYGTPEYQALLDEINPSIQRHYTRHPHHPQHYPQGFTGMTLVDVVEMFCDWQAAVRRHKDGDLNKSIEVNKDRFGYSDDVAALLRNQAKPFYSAELAAVEIFLDWYIKN